MIRINCKDNDGPWCNNKNIKRCLFGLGARMCIDYPYFNNICKIREPFPKPQIHPPAQNPKVKS